MQIATRIAKQFNTQDPRKLANTKKISKLHRIIA